MKTMVAIFLLALVLIVVSTTITVAPQQRFMKIELCIATGRTFDDCAASIPLTAWDRAYDAIFR